MFLLGFQKEINLMISFDLQNPSKKSLLLKGWEQNLKFLLRVDPFKKENKTEKMQVLPLELYSFTYFPLRGKTIIHFCPLAIMLGPLLQSSR